MSIKEQIIDWIALRTGYRTSPEFYRQAESKIETLASATGHGSLEDLWQDLDENGKTSEAWLPALGHCLDHTSSFLLTQNQYEVMGDKPLARLLKRLEKNKTIRIWCAGAGQGHEAFGIAMYLQTQIEHSHRWSFQILATDISPENITFAQAKTFSVDSIPEDFPNVWRESFMQENESELTISPDLKATMEFKILNLADSLSSIPICDIVIIRNILPKLRDEIQLHLGTQLLNHLHPDSLVILDPESKAPGEEGLLKSITADCGLFQLNRKILPPEIFNRYELSEGVDEKFEADFTLDEAMVEDDNRGYRKLEMSPEDYAWLIRYVRNLKLFENIPEAAIGEICKRIELFEFDLGVTMVQAGQSGEAFFIIYKGEVDVWSHASLLKKPVHSATLEPGDVFGEMSIILDVPANATVKGNDVTQVFALSRALFKYLLDKNESFKNHLGSMVAERALDAGVKRSLQKSGLRLPDLNVDFSVLKNLFGNSSKSAISEEEGMPEDDSPNEEAPVDPAVEEATKRDFLELLKLSRDLPLFNDAPLQELQPSPGQVLLYEFPTNYKIIKESKRPDAVYLIAEGRVRVSTGGKLFKKEVGLAILGRGQLVGEISLLRGGPSIAQVVTQGEVRAFRIDKALFKNWCEKSEIFRQNVEDIIDEREPPSSD